MEIEGYEIYEKKQINGIVWLYATRENEKYRLRRFNSPRFLICNIRKSCEIVRQGNSIVYYLREKMLAYNSDGGVVNF